MQIGIRQTRTHYLVANITSVFLEDWIPFRSKLFWSDYFESAVNSPYLAQRRIHGS